MTNEKFLLSPMVSKESVIDLLGMSYLNTIYAIYLYTYDIYDIPMYIYMYMTCQCSIT